MRRGKAIGKIVHAEKIAFFGNVLASQRHVHSDHTFVNMFLDDLKASRSPLALHWVLLEQHRELQYKQRRTHRTEEAKYVHVYHPCFSSPTRNECILHLDYSL